MPLQKVKSQKTISKNIKEMNDSPGPHFKKRIAKVGKAQAQKEMVAAAETTLASAAKATDSMAKKAELARISEAFAKARASLSDEDRRENTLSDPARAKRSRAKKAP